MIWYNVSSNVWGGIEMKQKGIYFMLRLKEKFFFSVIYHGFVYIIPLILTGATACALMNLPIRGYQELLTGDNFQLIYRILNIIYAATFGCFSLALVISISASYAMGRNEKAEDIIIYIMISLASFGTQLNIGTENFSTDILGAQGCFTAVFVTCLSCCIYSKIHNKTIMCLNQYTVGMERICAQAMNAIIPMLFITGIFSLFNQCLYEIFGVENIQEIVYKGLFVIFNHLHSEFAMGFAYTFILHLLWIMGFHGSHMMEVVVPEYFSEVGEGIIFSKSFFDAFVVMGGCGTTICVLVLIMLLFRRKSLGNIGKISIFTVIFNANEVLNFGIPIILNPMMAIPFLLTPIMAYCMAFLAIYFQLVPPVVQQVIWTTPVIASGYLATNSIRGSILQMIIIVLGMGIYYPFLKINEKIQGMHLKNQIKKLVEEQKRRENENDPLDFLQRTDNYGMVARMLLKDLEVAIEQDEIYMLFQPQINEKGRCMGAEALVRWEHQEYGFIYPPLIIYLAKEGKILPKLEKQIFDLASRAIRKTADNYDGDFKISVNITAKSFAWDIEEWISRCMEKYQITPEKMWIEITEQDVLTNAEMVIEKLKHLKQVGHTLLIDDFGMGHTSLVYLQSNYFNVVKLDGSLVRDILENSTDQKIVASVVELGQKLGVDVIAEYVETEDQKDKLKELGCYWYQGYLYSKPIKLDEFIEWMKECNKNENT